MKYLRLVSILLLAILLNTYSINLGAQNGYTLILEGYDWGPAVSKVVLTLDEEAKQVQYKDYTVFATRHSDCVDLPANQASGKREVIHAYISDEKGNKLNEGKHITLVMSVAPNLPITNPIQYSRNAKCSGNNWIDYKLTIVESSTGRIWNKEVDSVMPLIDRFDLGGKFSHKNTNLTYASYTPPNNGKKQPLIIWLHGGGEGGTDSSIPLVANRAANYASDDIQLYFDGAYVLVPQSPTYWMDNGEGGYTRGDKNDIYNEALMALFEDYISKNPNIDQDRIYVGGCSNGGYMSLKLLLLHPKYFAAGYISALAYNAEHITDSEIEKIKDIPIWFVHSADDRTTVADETVVPLYKRLKSAGAQNVYFSYYEHVVDITGFYGGEAYQYPGHWSWIYCHANKCRTDVDGSLVKIDGRPVSIMEWMAVQSK